MRDDLKLYPSRVLILTPCINFHALLADVAQMLPFSIVQFMLTREMSDEGLYPISKEFPLELARRQARGGWKQKPVLASLGDRASEDVSDPNLSEKGFNH